ncbi:MAG TPA: hypothetical protein VJO54_15195 [Burkholderiales bacterium]|nr:hypothetical protein [Burkholderiales bacterium]
MSNPSFAVHGVGEALGERVQSGGAGADQPQQLDCPCAPGGKLQRAHFFQCQMIVKMVFHAP